VDDSHYNTGDSQNNRNKEDPTTTEYGESQVPQPRGNDGNDYTSNENDQSNTQLDSSKLYQTEDQNNYDGGNGGKPKIEVRYWFGNEK
jgi:hypothetical protein